MNLTQSRFFLHVSYRVAAAVAAVFTAAFTGCSDAAPASSEQPVAKVTVTPVVSQETTDFDEYLGKTEGSQIVEVRARVSGFIKLADFIEGGFVKEGKELFKIEPDEYEAIHKQSESRVALMVAKRDLAKAKLDRNDFLLKKGAVSQEDFEESQAAYREATAAIAAAEADVARTALDVKYTTVTAPIDGRIDRKLVTPGNLVTGGLGSGTLLTKIVKEQPMHVYFDVDERSLLRYKRLRAGESATASGSLKDQEIDCFVKLTDEQDFKHKGKLDFAASEVETGTGTGRIRGEFTNEKRELASGMSVRVRIPVGKAYQALLVPEQALMTDLSIKYVYVVGDDGTATRRTVELGRQVGERRIIRSGLKEGDRVIVKGQQRVRPGQKVEAELQKPAPSSEKPTASAEKPAASAEKPAASAEKPAASAEKPAASAETPAAQN